MAINDDRRDRPTPHTKVIEEFEPESVHNNRVLKVVQYLRGYRTPGEISLQQDVIPALYAVNGAVAVTFRHDEKTEYVWPAAGEHDVRSSCFHDSGHAHMQDVPMSRDELADHREMPMPNDFAHVSWVGHMRPDHAVGGDADE